MEEYKEAEEILRRCDPELLAQFHAKTSGDRDNRRAVAENVTKLLEKEQVDFIMMCIDVEYVQRARVTLRHLINHILVSDWLDTKFHPRGNSTKLEHALMVATNNIQVDRSRWIKASGFWETADQVALRTATIPTSAQQLYDSIVQFMFVPLPDERIDLSFILKCIIDENNAIVDRVSNSAGEWGDFPIWAGVERFVKARAWFVLEQFL